MLRKVHTFCSLDTLSTARHQNIGHERCGLLEVIKRERAPFASVLGQVFGARPQNVSDLFLRGLAWLLQVLIAESLKLEKLFSSAVGKLPICVHDHGMWQHLVREQFCLHELIVELIHLSVGNQNLESDFVSPVHQFLSLSHCELEELLSCNPCKNFLLLCKTHDSGLRVV